MLFPFFILNMATIVQLIQQYSDDSGNIVIPDEQKSVLVEALMAIRKPNISNTKKKKGFHIQPTQRVD